MEAHEMGDLGDSQTLSGRALDQFIARLITKAVVVLIVVAIISVVQMLRLGASGRYLWLLAGSVLSIVVLIAYPWQVVCERGQPRRSVLGAITGFSGFIPYLFGCYLVFYEGLWRLRALLEGFSGMVIVVALLSIVAGYTVVLAIYKVSEFGRAVGDGRLKIG